MTAETKKGQIHLYCAYLTSMYFESLSDLINFELCSRRFNGNMTKFHYNPFPLTKKTRKFFPSLQTLFIYSSFDNRFEHDKKIKQRKEIKIEEYNLTVLEKKQIEEWTGMEMKEVIFDSDNPEDKWSEDDRNLHEKIGGREQFVLIVEDTEGNKFGCYYNTEVKNVVKQWHITNSKTFSFSLASNGRCDGMTRFDINEHGKKNGFYLLEKSYDWLFGIGYDIWLTKKNVNRGMCMQSAFEYNGIEEALCGKTGQNNPFIPKRFLFIQMFEEKKEEKCIIN